MGKKSLISILIILIAGIGAFYYFSPLFGKKFTVENKISENNPEISEIEAVPEEDAKTQNSAIQSDSQKPVNKPDVPVENIAKEANTSIIQKLVSWGYQAGSSRKIDTVIVHSSYNALGGNEYSLDKLLEEYKSYGVAPHYLINREGIIYQLVQNKNIAYHAGESKTPDGRTNVNSFSLGIELMNTEKDSCTASQYKALNTLIAKFKKQYSIKYILGHNQIAPGRKSDPWNFEWNKVNK